MASRVALIGVGILFMIIHIFYVATMFQNNLNFSHLSNLEREMSLRTEAGFYYSFYKVVIESPSFFNGVVELVSDEKTEYPARINSLQRFNLYPEIVSGGLYKIGLSILDRFGITGHQCWKVDRGSNLLPVTSCEGIREPIYFYLQVVWVFSGITTLCIFFYGYLLSDSLLGGILAGLCYFYNHTECTRVMWSPPLRENFAYPILVADMMYCTYYLRRNTQKEWKSKSVSMLYQVVPVFLSTMCCLLFWQFSQFVFLAKTAALFLMFLCRMINRDSLLCILIGQGLGTIGAASLLFGNLFVVSSLLICVSMSITAALLAIRYNIVSDNYISYIIKVTLLSIIITFGMKTFFIYGMGVTDDKHIFDVLKAKFFGTQNFHTLLYTCVPEFDFLKLSYFESITQTLLLPVAMCGIVGEICHWIWLCKNAHSCNYQLKDVIDPHILFNLIMLLAFGTMAMCFMRFKLFFTPHLCVLASLITSKKYFNFLRIHKMHYIILAGIVAIMSMKGIENIEIERNMIGEFSDVQLENLLTWINASTPPDAVFGGPMGIMASIKLSTNRNIVNHPHYENTDLRAKTREIYSIFSRKHPKDVHKILRNLHIDYVVVDSRHCFSQSYRNGCTMLDIWDKEDPENAANPPLCIYFFYDDKEPFSKVYQSKDYVVLSVR